MFSFAGDLACRSWSENDHPAWFVGDQRYLHRRVSNEVEGERESEAAMCWAGFDDGDEKGRDSIWWKGGAKDFFASFSKVGSVPEVCFCPNRPWARCLGTPWRPVTESLIASLHAAQHTADACRCCRKAEETPKRLSGRLL